MADAISLLNGAIIPDLLYSDRFPEINKDNLSSIMLSQPPNVLNDFIGIMAIDFSCIDDFCTISTHLMI